MEDLYSIHPGIPPLEELPAVEALAHCAISADLWRRDSSSAAAAAATALSSPSSAASNFLRPQIATHPRYPALLSAYVECRKVGAPPEMAAQLEEIRRGASLAAVCGEISDDPELDHFMESYCHALNRYKEELSKPFDEATSFLNSIELQLSDLCNSGAATTGGYSSSAPEERKKGNLPKGARALLMDWWTKHYQWPYPTDEEKVKLVEVTGLDQKQINNWFINQRKRHWKPSEGMRSTLVDGITGGSHSTTRYFGMALGQ
ncbi:unnamed protein product [Spirodela intermedia]|uniref:Homeobox domain-containing protein n=1 Tax=Spirodela intermedia TaxID=51605 RepID=A0A7I8IZK8_SPIIN|nr:unnamed protein product [Spirodela intermedia]CAA6663406.1 unnamed protein product [Spirodela intermedia]